GQIHEFAKNKWQVTALLHHFDVASPELKPEHVLWLSSNLGSLLGNNMTIFACGLASRTGPDRFNLALSHSRANRVMTYIKSLNGWRLTTNTKVAVGEEAARLIGVRDNVEDGLWRGVFLSAQD